MLRSSDVVMPLVGQGFIIERVLKKQITNYGNRKTVIKLPRVTSTNRPYRYFIWSPNIYLAYF
jgi:hypothetical protein